MGRDVCIYAMSPQRVYWMHWGLNESLCVGGRQMRRMVAALLCLVAVSRSGVMFRMRGFSRKNTLASYRKYLKRCRCMMQVAMIHTV